MRVFKRVYSLNQLANMRIFNANTYAGYDIALDLTRDSYTDNIHLPHHRVELDGDEVTVTLSSEPLNKRPSK